MTGSRPMSSGLRALRPAAFGADPAGERMARIRRSPHFEDGVFVNPGGPARTRPAGSATDFAKVYFDKEARPGAPRRARSPCTPPRSPTSPGRRPRGCG